MIRMTKLLKIAICFGVGVLVVVFLVLTTLLVFARPRDEQPPAKMTYSQPFKGKPEDMQRYALRGPDVTHHLNFEPDGLRINLPSGYPGQRPSTGLIFNSTLQGNFEVTARFELLKEPNPQDAGIHATRVTLGVILDTPERNEAAISRRMIAKGTTQFFTFLFMELNANGKTQPKLHTAPTEAKTGRLRLVRTGSELACFASEGANEEFTLIKEHPFSPLDVKQVFVHTSTGGPKAELDVRISDLCIVADSLPDLAGSEVPLPGTRKWLAAAIITNLLLVFVLIVAALAMRQLRNTQDKSTPTGQTR